MLATVTSILRKPSGRRRRKRIILKQGIGWLLALGANAAVADQSSAPTENAFVTDQTTVVASRDATLNVKRPTKRLGSRDSLVADEPDRFVALVGFPVPELPGDLLSAQLQLRVLRLGGVNELRLRVVAGAWSEATVSYDNAPRGAGEPLIVPAAELPQDSLLRVDVSSLVALGASDLTLEITTDSGQLRVESREATTPPALVMTYAAEPGPPLAFADNFLVVPGGTVDGSVLADNGAGADRLGTPPSTVMVLSAPAAGELTLEQDGQFAYVAPEILEDPVTFEYAIQDGLGMVSAPALVTLRPRAPPGSQPNIVLFVADDIGWGDLPVYNAESTVPMPNLDLIAQRGVRFTDAHTAASLCAPSRYSILTGNYHWRGRLEYGSWEYTGGSQILPGQLTLGNMLQERGYVTAAIGKQHLGGDFYLRNSNNFAKRAGIRHRRVDFTRQYRNGPLEKGFDYSFTALSGLQASPYAFFENDLLVGSDGRDFITWLPGVYGTSEIQHEGFGSPDWDSSTVGPRLGAKAIEFIDAHETQRQLEGGDQPFFLYYASQSIHGPYTPPESFLGTTVAGVTGHTARADMAYEVDVAMGKILEALDRHGITDNTIVVFTSDNGGLDRRTMGYDSTAGLNGEKGDALEGGHRVPFIVSWPDGGLAEGGVSEHLIAVQDVVATLLDLIEAPVPSQQALDSVSLSPLLFDPQLSATPRTEMLHHARFFQGARTPHYFAIRSGDLKLILDEDERPRRLYNLADDLYETTNLANRPEYAEQVDELLARFRAIRASDRTVIHGD